MKMPGEPKTPASLTFQSLSRMRRVSGRKRGFSPASSLACTAFLLQRTHTTDWKVSSYIMPTTEG